MSRSKTRRASTKRRSAVERARSVPWAALVQAGVVVHGRWRRLSAKDRARAMRLVRDSHGRLSRLGAKERDELRRLLRKADLKGLGPELMALRARRRRKHR
jgi:hypothetical protein